IAHDLRNLQALALLAQDRVKECEQVTMESLAVYDILNLDRQMKFLPTLLHIASYLKICAGRFEEALEYIWQSARLVGHTTGVIMLINKSLEQSICLAQGKL